MRLSYWSCHRMGISLEPTNKRFNSAYLQNSFVICRKFSSDTFGLYATFSKKKLDLKQKNRTKIFNYGPTRHARQKIETSSYWKFIEVTHSRNSGRGRGIGVINILLKLFFFRIADLVHRRTAALDPWHVTHDTGCGVKILSKFQLSSFYGLGKTVYWRYLD